MPRDLSDAATVAAAPVPAPAASGSRAVEEPDYGPFLLHEVRVEIADGRVVVGTLLAFQGSGDLLLHEVVEQRRMKDDFVVIRRLNLIAIPYKHVRKLHKRRKGLPTLYSIVTDAAEERAASHSRRN